jgi:hypothetical protein
VFISKGRGSSRSRVRVVRKKDLLYGLEVQDLCGIENNCWRRGLLVMMTVYSALIYRGLLARWCDVAIRDRIHDIKSPLCFGVNVSGLALVIKI